MSNTKHNQVDIFSAQNKLVDIAILFGYKVLINSATFELDGEKYFREVWPGMNIRAFQKTFFFSRKSKVQPTKH